MQLDRTGWHHATPEGCASLKDAYKKFATQTSMVIAQRMAADYVRKKKAFEASKTQYRKTGSLDMSRLASYLTSDDIFISKSITKEGKSHGLVITLDWSSSMRSSVLKMAIQALITCKFAKAAGIEFQLSIFTDNDSSYNYSTRNNFGSLAQTLLLDSTNSYSDMNEVFYHMCAYHHIGATRSFTHEYANMLRDTFRMSGTPLAQSQVMSYIEATRMRSNHGLQNVSIMYITDGDGSNLYGSNGSANHIVCPFTKRRYEYQKDKYNSYYKNPTPVINRMIRDAGFKTFNIYVYGSGQNQIDHYVSSNNPGLKTSDFANERFESMLSLRNCANYDAVLFAPNNAFPNIAHISDDDEEETKATKVTANTLKKQAGSHRRLALIGEFIVNEICKDFKVV
jgi:hypothetical protein